MYKSATLQWEAKQQEKQAQLRKLHQTSYSSKKEQYNSYDDCHHVID